MKVESVNLYHIGIKLNSQLDIGELHKIMQDFCNVEMYEQKKAPQTNLMGSFIPLELNTGKLDLGEKEGVTIQIHFILKAINFVGKDPVKVTESFHKALKYLTDTKNYENPSEFYEVLLEASLSNGRTPMEILNANTNLNLEKLSSLAGPSGVCGIHIKSKGNISEENGGMDIVLEPHPNRPSKEFHVRVVWRTKDIDKLLSFHEHIKSILVSLLR